MLGKIKIFAVALFGNIFNFTQFSEDISLQREIGLVKYLSKPFYFIIFKTTTGFHLSCFERKIWVKLELVISGRFCFQDKTMEDVQMAIGRWEWRDITSFSLHFHNTLTLWYRQQPSVCHVSCLPFSSPSLFILRADLKLELSKRPGSDEMPPSSFFLLYILCTYLTGDFFN